MYWQYRISLSAFGMKTSEYRISGLNIASLQTRRLNASSSWHTLYSNCNHDFLMLSGVF